MTNSNISESLRIARLDDSNRGTGRSFRDMMRLCLEASENPNTWITVDDHHGDWRSNEYTWYRIHELLQYACIDCDGRKFNGQYQFMIKRN